MKKINILLFFSLCYFLSQAQISFLNADMPTLPWNDAQQKDTSVSDVINTNFGNPGANQVYDFSMFHNRILDTAYYLVPTSAQTTAVPNANLAVTGDHVTYLMGQKQTSYFAFDGLQSQVGSNSPIISNYSPIDTYYKFPSIYNQNFRGTYGGTTTVPASQVGITTFGANQVRITNTTTYTDTIDGWGTVKTPIGTYNCLRQKRIENSTTVIAYNTIFSNTFTTYETLNSTTLSYNYLAKETHGSVITFTYDSINQPLTASWSTTPPYPVANFGYTLGASGQVTFTDSSTGAPFSSYSWSFGDGTANGTSSNANHIYTRDSSYVVCLTVTNASGSDTKCDTVHITNIVVGTPPIAQITPSGHDTICPGASVILRAQTANGYTFRWSNATHSTADSIIVTTGGPYTVTVYNATDSAISAPTTVVISGTPNATMTLSGASTFCAGDSVTLAAASGLSYNWSTTATSQDITVYATGNYTVTVTNSNGCTASSVQHITVNTPAADNITQSGLVLTSASESSYQWYQGTTLLSGDTSQSYTATQNGVYSVHITDANGCSSVSNSITITGVGINEISAADYRVYPNPASDMIQLDLSRLDQNTINTLSEIVVYDMLGQKLKSQSINETSISVRDLSNGVYMIAVTDKNQNRKVLGKFEVLR
jgi:PKD repeat protein